MQPPVSGGRLLVGWVANSASIVLRVWLHGCRAGRRPWSQCSSHAVTIFMTFACPFAVSEATSKGIDGAGRWLAIPARFPRIRVALPLTKLDSHGRQASNQSSSRAHTASDKKNSRIKQFSQRSWMHASQRTMR